MLAKFYSRCISLAGRQRLKSRLCSGASQAKDSAASRNEWQIALRGACANHNSAHGLPQTLPSASASVPQGTRPSSPARAGERLHWRGDQRLRDDRRSRLHARYRNYLALPVSLRRSWPRISKQRPYRVCRLRLHAAKSPSVEIPPLPVVAPDPLRLLRPQTSFMPPVWRPWRDGVSAVAGIGERFYQ